MQALRKALAGNKTRVKRVYQRLSWHARRRTMSHSASRMPRRLRTAHMRELERGGAVCDVGKKLWRRRAKKYRGKARFLKALRRVRVERQMETHVWHAKRFRMSEGVGGGGGGAGKIGGGKGVGKGAGKVKGKEKGKEGKGKEKEKDQDHDKEQDKEKGSNKEKYKDKGICKAKEIQKGDEGGKDQQGGAVKNNGEIATTTTTTVATPAVNVKWALTCNDRGVRSMAKAVNRGCVAQDISFWKTVQIDACDRLQAKELLLRVTTHDDRRRIITAFNANAGEGIEALISTSAAGTGTAGQQRVSHTGEGHANPNKMVTQAATPPQAARIVRNVICRDCATGMAVAPMDVMFRTVTPDAPVTGTATGNHTTNTAVTDKDEAGMGGQETEKENDLQKKTHTETWALIWLRPEVASSGLRALQAAAAACCDAGNGNDGDGNETMNLQTLQASYVTNAPVRFSVYGPRAEIVLGKVLAADIVNVGGEANGRIALASARGVREGVVLTGLWLRPASPWVTRATKTADHNTPSPQPAPSSSSFCSLWDDDTRLRLRRHGRAAATGQLTTASTGVGSGDAVATTTPKNKTLTSTDGVPVPPVWLLQRGNTAGDAYGWDVVSACGWGMALWQRLMYANHGRALGDLDLRGVQMMRPRGALFPDEFVDCADAARLVRDRHAAAVAEQKRKPPAKRREIGDGLMSVLEELMVTTVNNNGGDGVEGRQEKEKRRRREVVIIRGVVRIRRLLQSQHPVVGNGKKKNEDEDEEGSTGFVLVRVTVVGKGTPKEGARVRACRLLQCQGKTQEKKGAGKADGEGERDDDDADAESEGADVGVVVAGSYGLGNGTGVGRALVRLDAMRELMRATVGRMTAAARQRDRARSKNKKTKKSKKTDADADAVVDLSGKWHVSVGAVFRNCEANSVWRRADLSIIY